MSKNTTTKKRGRGLTYVSNNLTREGFDALSSLMTRTKWNQRTALSESCIYANQNIQRGTP